MMDRASSLGARGARPIGGPSSSGTALRPVRSCGPQRRAVQVHARAPRYDRRKPPPPDLPSLLFDQRIVYLGMPVRQGAAAELWSAGGARWVHPSRWALLDLENPPRAQLVPAVTELMVAELLYLEKQGAQLPIEMLINSSGTTRQDGEIVRRARRGGLGWAAGATEGAMAHWESQVADPRLCTGPSPCCSAQLAFDSEGIALTSTMGFVRNPVRLGDGGSSSGMGSAQQNTRARMHGPRGGRACGGCGEKAALHTELSM
jgi:hypothetical protein